jgi:transposase
MATKHQLARPVGSFEQLKDYRKLAERIRKLHADGLHHFQIAEVLNREGFTPPRRRGDFNQRQKELVLQSPVLWTDDTPVTLLSSGQEGSRTDRFWTYIAEEHPYSVYDFTESRARDGPANLLRGFEGYLHADAYSGYDQIYLGSNDAVREVACWAHARRKFFDASHSSPRDAQQILEWIRQLYDVEDRARERSADTRQKIRAAEATPVLDRIGTRLAELEKRALPKSVLAKAVSYANNQWQALRRYVEDGRLWIDHNLSERTLCHQAIGRKNWLFLGSEQAGSFPKRVVVTTP